jgi:predicted dehydrogenase
MNTALRVGLIGAGYMGRAHAIAFHGVGATFGPRYAVECVALADHSARSAEIGAQALGFSRGVADWRELIEDPTLDLLDICAPNYLHCEMALAALRAGKHVYCEKPLANDVSGALEVARAARASGRQCAMGFNYICNPLLQWARALIASGELGDIVSFNGRYLEDYMGDPRAPFTWRCERRLAGAGALADLGSHLINLAHYLLGPIERVAAVLETVHRERVPPAESRPRAVENEDNAHVLIELASGVRGVMQISRVATGYKCGLAVRVQGTRGSIAFDQERMNELRLYQADDPEGRRGFRTLLTGPDHPDYAAFCPAPGHGLGVNDLKVIEVRNVVRAVREQQPVWPDFAEGLRVQQVMAAIEASHASGAWTRVEQESR